MPLRALDAAGFGVHSLSSVTQATTVQHGHRIHGTRPPRAPAALLRARGTTPTITTDDNGKDSVRRRRRQRPQDSRLYRAACPPRSWLRPCVRPGEPRRRWRNGITNYDGDNGGGGGATTMPYASCHLQCSTAGSRHARHVTVRPGRSLVRREPVERHTTLTRGGRVPFTTTLPP